MKNKLVLLVSVLILTVNGFSQLSWQSLKTGGGTTNSNNFDMVYGLTKDASNNIYSCGVFHGTVNFGGNYNYLATVRTSYITKKDIYGTSIWQYVPNGTGVNSAYNLTIDLDGNIIVCGQYSGSISFGTTTLTAGVGTNSVYVAKLNGSTGLPIWAVALKSAGNSGTADIIATGISTHTDGSIYVGGSYLGTGLTFNLGTTFGSTTNASNTLVRDGFLLKLTTSGTSVWLQRALGTNGSSANYDKSIYGVAVDGNGNPVVVGFFKSGKITMYPGGTNVNNSYTSGSYNDAFLASWNSAGADIGITKYGNSYEDEYLYGIDLMPDNNFAVCGQFNNSAIVNKVSSSTRAVTNTFTSTATSYSSLYDLDCDATGNIYTTGIITRTTSFGTNTLTLAATQQDIFFGKISTSNTWEWAKNVGTASTSSLNDIGRSIVVISNDDLVIGGSFAETINLGSFSAQALGNGDFFQARYANCVSTLAITSQPSNISQCGNTPATLSTTSNVTSSFQWYKNGSAIVGATSSTYNFTIPLSDNGATFYCIVREAGSCGIDTTNTVTASLTSGFSITTQPLTQTICTDNNLNLSVAATGSGLTYQWKKDGNSILNATNSNYIINSVSSNDAATYTVDISTSNCGVISSNNAIITVNASTAISTQPVSVSTCTGSNVQLSVSATGTNLTYQWLKDNVNLNNAVTSTLIFPSVNQANAGSYTLLVTGACNSVLSNTANITVNQNTSVIIDYGYNTTLCEGQELSLNIITTGANLTYQWYKDASAITGATNSNFIIPSLTTADIGYYYVYVTGACGSVTSDATYLLVRGLTNITQQPQTTSACENNYTQIYVAASGVNMSYQWYKNNTILANQNGVNIDLYNEPGDYYVAISNGCSTINSDTVSVTFNANTIINSQPSNQTGCVGEQVTLTVDAVGASLTYQWIKDGYNVPNSNSPICTIYNVGTIDEGSYKVYISGACGNLFSDIITVQVGEPTSATITETACNSYTIGGQTFTTTGTHTAIIPNTSGCDSTITLNLTIENIDMNVSINGTTLSAATNANATYQWYNCDSQSIIPNETQSTYTASTSGNYAVIISNGNCSDTSACQNVNVVGLNEFDLNTINVYPNPTSGKFTIQTKMNSNLTITNVIGENLMEMSNNSNYHIDLSNYVNGIYFIKDNTTNKTIRIVKQQ